MVKRSSKKDFAQTALRVVEISTGEPLKAAEKNPAAVALGRLGGLKGGKRRAASMTAERKSEIAQKAAKARNGGGDDLHPFIKGLLDKLPKADTPWALDARKKWLQTALNIFDLMYTTPADADGELSVVLTKGSAK